MLRAAYFISSAKWFSADRISQVINIKPNYIWERKYMLEFESIHLSKSTWGLELPLKNYDSCGSIDILANDILEIFWPCKDILVPFALENHLKCTLDIEINLYEDHLELPVSCELSVETLKKLHELNSTFHITHHFHYYAREKRKYNPILPVGAMFSTNASSRFWGFDIRRDKNGNECSGIFLDIETYDKAHSITFYISDPVIYIGWTDKNEIFPETAFRRKNHPNFVESYAYLVENSELIKQYQSMDEEDILFHYALWSMDGDIDVICKSKPIIFDIQ